MSALGRGATSDAAERPGRWSEPAADGTRQVSGLSKQQAEELLDWLEMQGVRESRVKYVRKQGFTVTYRS